MSQRNVFKYILHAQKEFSLSWNKYLTVFSMPVHVSGAQYLPSKNKHFRFSWSVTKGFTVFKEHRSKFKMFLEICFVQHAQTKTVYLSNYKNSSFDDCKNCKACFHVLNIPFMEHKPTINLFRGDGTICFATKASGDYEKEKPNPFLRSFLRHSQSSTPKPLPWKKKIVPFMA